MTCARCKGTGRIYDPETYKYDGIDCPECSGEGDSLAAQIAALRYAVNDLAKRVEKLEEQCRSKS